MRRNWLMRRKITAGTLVALAVGAWTVSSLPAQQPNADRPKRVLLIDQIDNLGRTIFDGILSPFQQASKHEPAVAPEDRPTRYANRPNLTHVQREEVDEPASERLAERVSPQGLPQSRTNLWDQWTGEKTSSAESKATPYANAYPPEMKSPPLGQSRLAVPAETMPKNLDRDPAPGTAEIRTQETSPGMPQSVADPTSKRLHERLSVLRESPFDDFPSKDVAADGPSAEAGSGQAVAENQSPREPSRQEAAPAAATRPHFADADAPARIAADSPEATAVKPDADPTPLRVETSTVIHPAPVQKGEAPPPDEEIASPRGPEPIADGDVLITRQSPILDVRTVGPRRITVGKPSAFVVNISNSGLVAANDAVVTIDLPEWADVVGTESTTGTAGWVQSAGVAKQYQWTVGRLDAKGKEQLTLNIVPRKSQPFDLAVRWDYKPVASQTLIEVQEPKLEMRLEGPRQILFGAKQVYRLELSNSGSGDAEDVEISLMPVGVGNRMPATHKLGVLAAGGKKAVEVELTARQDGELTVEVEARGDAGATAKLVEKIVVVRPALKVEIEGPPMQYAGTVAKYLIRVANPGTAAAGNVRVSATIPAGARHELSTPTASLTPDGKELTWTLESIAAGAEKTFTLHCTLDESGARRLSVRTTADNDLTAMADATTLVETMPDLALAVKDPVGPIAVGAEATYQVAIQNRGTETAEDVEVVAYFSRGIEPTAAEGAEYSISPGQIVFQKIASLGVGKGISLLVHAKAETAGNHVFRVEVYCKASGIRLVSEEMTHYYSGSDGPQQATRENAASEDRYLRTAERPQAEESSQ
jgi:uncharacterized repeat protein (TIGR01451 family)